MKNQWFATLVLTILVTAAAAPAFAVDPYVGLFGDTLGGPGGATHSRTETWANAPWTEIEMWVWWKPDPAKGLTAGEYKIIYPSFVIPIDLTSNPLNVVEIGWPDYGISFTVGAQHCQYDWYWSHRQNLLVKSTTQYGYVQIVPDPTIPSPPYNILMTSCEPGFPIYTCAGTSLGINNIRCSPLPLNGAAPQASTLLTASFVRYIYVGCGTTEYRSIFRLYPKFAPADTIIILHGLANCPYYGQDGCDSFNLSLAEPMTDGTTYVLEANVYTESCVCANARGLLCLPLDNCGPFHSTFEFTYHAPIGTLLQASSASLRGAVIEIAWELSAVDAGTSFFVSRSENGGDFRALDAAGLLRNGLRFSYVDRAVEAGRSYTYKVEYGLGAPSRVLFISEAVTTPAMPLTLYQNKPNPFNPSTTISFYLPQECVVGLEVYDIAGRLVARLIAGERRGSGTHQVEWNGRDSRGAAVSSGIYFYRLSAGKETISKKMVLLR